MTQQLLRFSYVFKRAQLCAFPRSEAVRLWGSCLTAWGRRGTRCVVREARLRWCRGVEPLDPPDAWFEPCAHWADVPQLRRDCVVPS